jgi:hypothetical protein
VGKGSVRHSIATRKEATVFLCSARYCLERFKKPRGYNRKNQQFQAL